MIPPPTDPFWADVPKPLRTVEPTEALVWVLWDEGEGLRAPIEGLGENALRLLSVKRATADGPAVLILVEEKF